MNDTKTVAPLGNIDFTNVELISGKRGTGKTYFLKYLVVKRFLKKGKVCIYDPLWQYDDLGKVVHSLTDISDSDLRDFSKAIVFQPIDTQDTPETLDAVAQFCYKKTNILLAVDELNEYLTPNYIPPHLRAFMRRGRNYGCGFIGITHRPAYLSLNFLNFIDHWFIFQQDLERDLDRVSEYLQRSKPTYVPAFNPQTMSKGEYIASLNDFIAQMPDRHFIYYSRNRETGQTVSQFCNPVKGTLSTQSSKMK